MNIVYLDTSSLVKLYVRETGSSQITRLVSESSAVVTSIIAYAEARAAFARQYRDNNLSPKEFEKIKIIFEDDWDRYLVVGLNKEILNIVGELVEKYDLRGFDAIHLASCLFFQRKVGQEMLFSSFNRKLNNAAKLEGLIP